MSEKTVFEKYIGGATWSVLSSGIVFMSYPLLSLLYPLQSFGELGVINASALIISVFLLFRLDYILISSKSLEKSFNYLVSGLFLGGSISIFISIALIFLSIFWGFEVFEFLLVLLLAAFLSFYNLLIFYFISLRDYRKANRSRLMRSMLIVIFQIGFYFLSESYGLIIGLIFGQGLTVFVQLCWCQRAFSYWSSIVKSKAKNAFNITATSLSENKVVIVKQLPQAGANGLVSNSLPIATEAIFGPAVAGSVVILEKLIKMPAGIILDAIRPILISDISLLTDPMDFKRFSNSLALSLFFSIIILVLGYFFGNISLGEWYPLWDELKFLVFPIASLTASMVVSLPIVCFLYAKNEFSALLAIELWRVSLIFVLTFVFYLFYGSSESELYIYFYSFSFLMPALVYASCVLLKYKRFGLEY